MINIPEATKDIIACIYILAYMISLSNPQAQCTCFTCRLHCSAATKQELKITGNL